MDMPRRRKILIVDDDERVARAVARALSRGSDCDVETSANRALLRACNEYFDAILIELDLRELGGELWYSIVRTARPHMADRVVFMSKGHLDPPFARPLLRKPFHVEEARSALDTVAPDEPISSIAPPA